MSVTRCTLVRALKLFLWQIQNLSPAHSVCFSSLCLFLVAAVLKPSLSNFIFPCNFFFSFCVILLRNTQASCVFVVIVVGFGFVLVVCLFFSVMVYFTVLVKAVLLKLDY